MWNISFPDIEWQYIYVFCLVGCWEGKINQNFTIRRKETVLLFSDDYSFINCTGVSILFCFTYVFKSTFCSVLTQKYFGWLHLHKYQFFTMLIRIDPQKCTLNMSFVEHPGPCNRWKCCYKSSLNGNAL